MTKRALSLTEFNKLDLGAKLNTVQRQGVYVGKRVVNGQRVVLYQLYGFYIEVYYRSYRKIVDAIYTTDTVEVLHPYLDQIQVRDLDQNRNKE